jgi:hypothetical protein
MNFKDQKKPKETAATSRQLAPELKQDEHHV